MTEPPHIAALRKKLERLADHDPQALELVAALVDELLTETADEPPDSPPPTRKARRQ